MKYIRKKNEYIFQANEYPLEKGVRLIEASAGTGKTFSLSHIVLRLLTEKKYSIEEILVVSFTEATASEIKAIIIKRLLSALKGLEDKDSQDKSDNVMEEWLKFAKENKKREIDFTVLILDALENIDHADITTIHGFCSRTLKREALETGTNFNPIIEKNSTSIINEVVNEYWVKEILSLHPSQLKGIVNSGITVDSISSYLNQLDGDPSKDFAISIESLNPLKPLKEQFNKFIEKSWLDFLYYWEKEGKELEEDLRYLAKESKDNGFLDTKPYSSNPRKDRHQLLSEWLCKYSTANKNIVPYYIDIRNQDIIADYYHPRILYAFKKRLGINFKYPLREKIQSSIANIYDGPAEFVLTHALGYIRKSLEEKRVERGLISYSDLLKSLDPNIFSSNLNQKNSNGIFESIRRRYKVALVDEFQDTDPLQWRILKKSFGENEDHLLIMIGDPKQAIYSFRGGDLKTYMQAREFSSRIDFLENNYRTAPTLMRSINKLFSIGLIHSSLSVPKLKPRSIEAPLSLMKGEYPLHIITICNTGQKPSEKKSQVLTKSNVENEIPNVVTNYLVNLLKKDNSINLRDICVLVNKHRQAENIRSALSSAGIATRLINQGNIFQTEAGEILQQFLNCLANPSDYKSLKRITCSPLIQWSLKRVSDSDHNGELDELAFKFTQWAKEITSNGLLGCLSQLIEARIIANLSRRGRLLSDLYQCTQLIEEAIHLNGLNPRGAAKWLKQKRLLTKGLEEDEYQPNSDIEEDSVNVITIHRSKGLQFKVVICPYLWESPSPHKGPLWKNQESSTWQISMNNGWNTKLNFLENTLKENIKEYERLAYVALTRAKSQLAIIWIPIVNQEQNPLKLLLFGTKALSLKNEELTTELMNEWIKQNKLELTIYNVNATKIDKKLNRKESAKDLELGPRPKRVLDKSWGRYSYSTWIKSIKNNEEESTNINPFEEVKDIDQNSDDHFSFFDQEISEKEYEPIVGLQKSGPLTYFPRGAMAGSCLHSILEKLDFQKPVNDIETIDLIKNELSSSGLDINLYIDIQKSLKNILNIPMGGPLGSLKLNEIKSNNRIHELNFDIPISEDRKPINSIEIANIFKLNPEAKFGVDYTKKLKNLNIYSKGFLTGSIDLVFADNQDQSKAKWWVLDWKSNWMGEEFLGSESIECGPYHYGEKDMHQQMLLHNYPLQAHLYLTALHRFLAWRLPNYAPKKNLGGYIYMFLRGIPDEESVQVKTMGGSIPGILIEKCPLNRILELDLLLKREIND